MAGSGPGGRYDVAQYAADMLAAQNAFGLGGRPYKPAASKFRRIQSRLGRVRSGGGNAVIALVGDSITRGTGAGSDATQGANGVAKQMATILGSLGITANSENVFGYGGYEQAFSTYDNRITVTGSFNRTPGGGIQSGGGQIFQATTTGTLTYAPVAQVTTVDIYYLNNGASFTYAVDGGSTTTVNTVNDSTIQKVTVACGAVGTHSVQVAWVSGTSYVLGFVGYNTGVGSRVDILNWGWHGSKVGDLSGAAQGFWSVDKLCTAVGADLLIEGYGGTNDWRGSVSAATYLTNFTTQLARFTALASPPDILLLTPPPDGTSTGLSAQQQDYVDARLGYAVANGSPIYDRWRNWSDEATMEAYGAMNTDKLHPTKTGYAMDADRIIQAFLG